MKFTNVKTSGKKTPVSIPISSDNKPQIPDQMVTKWQKIIELVAKIIDVPSGLVTRLQNNVLEVVATNNARQNIFSSDSAFDLGLGWYCESVAATRTPQEVNFAPEDPEWKNNNPSLEFNLVSYLGVPILWPDGEVFGTFCVLDKKKNNYSEQYKELLLTFREIIHNDLKTLLELQESKTSALRNELQLIEIHHSIKNHFNMLISSINLQKGTIDKQQQYSEVNMEQAFNDIQARITTLALVHDKLYRTAELNEIKLTEYLCSLGSTITEDISKCDVKFSCDGPEISAPTSISIPCGLILNELITNSLKYALCDDKSLEITFKIRQKNKKISLEYFDNGPGLQENAVSTYQESLGMMLITQLVNQLDGTQKIKSKDGFYIFIEFPLE